MLSEQKKDYSDIIDLSHPTFRKHPRMSMEARAAQFAPFAALIGHKEELQEERRLTKKKIIQDEDYREKMDYVLEDICKNGAGTKVRCTYFVTDKKKDGGEYVTEEKLFKRIDAGMGCIVWENGEMVCLEDIVDIEIVE